MPAKSKSQMRYIFMLQNKYKTKKNTPEKNKWIWNDEWLDVDFKNLPDKIGEDIFESFKTFENFKIDVKRGINIFDFDETLIVTKAKIKITDYKGKTFELSSKELNKYNKEKIKNVDFKDFSDPEILHNGKLIDWTMKILKNTYIKGKPVAIITARSDKKLIRDFFKSQNLNIHKDLIYAINEPSFIKKYNTKNTGELKKCAVRELINKGFKDIKFFDDNQNNLNKVKELENESDAKIKTKLIKQKWIPKINENLLDF